MDRGRIKVQALAATRERTGSGAGRRRPHAGQGSSRRTGARPAARGARAASRRSDPRRGAAVTPFQLRPRLYHGAEIALGPGKADLLRAIDATGSIRLAAKRLDMSYARAWNLVRTMTQCFAEPLVETRRGGASRGAARLTPTGRRVLAVYERLIAECTYAAAPYANVLRRYLRR